MSNRTITDLESGAQAVTAKASSIGKGPEIEFCENPSVVIIINKNMRACQPDFNLLTMMVSIAWSYRNSLLLQWPMRNLYSYLLLALLCLCLYIPGLAQIPLIDRDEPHFAQASRQMVESGNYWKIRFQDQPRHLKPPGIYWLQASAVKLFSSPDSISPWPYRLPSVLGALLAVLITFTMARRVCDEKNARLAAIFLACSILLIVEAHLAVTDAVLLATIVAMQLALSRIYLYPSHRQSQHLHTIPSWVWPFCFWVAMAAGVLIKGITPLVAGLTILALFAMDRNIAWVKNLRAQWGVPLLLLLSLAWLIPLSLHSGHFFLWDMIHNDVLPKLAGNQQSHGMPTGYFTLILTAAFWPGSLFIVPTGLWAWRHRHLPMVRFFSAWILSNWIFFEIVHTKLPEYVLPVYPAITVLVAMALMNTEPDKGFLSMPKWLWVVTIIQQTLWLICSLSLIGGCIYLGGWGWLAAMVITIASIFLIACFYSTQWRPYTGTAVIMASLAFIPILQFTLPQQNTWWLSSKIAELISQQAPEAINETHPLLVTDYQEPSLVFLLGADRVRMNSLTQAVNCNQHSQQLLLISQQQLANFKILSEKNHCAWQVLATMQGIQYNKKGKQVMLYLISLAPR